MGQIRIKYNDTVYENITNPFLYANISIILKSMLLDFFSRLIYSIFTFLILAQKLLKCCVNQAKHLVRPNPDYRPVLNSTVDRQHVGGSFI